MAELDEIFSPGGESAPVEKEQTQPIETKTQESERTSPEAETHDDAGDTRQVPVAALQKEREKAKRYTEQIAEFNRRLDETNTAWAQRFEQLQASLQPKKEAAPPPDFFEAPADAVSFHVNQAVTPLQQAIQQQQQQFMQQRDAMSRRMAIKEHGEEAVTEAFEALKSMRGSPAFDPLFRQIMSSELPYDQLMTWHKAEVARQKIGDDPEAFIEAEVSRRLAAMQQDGQTAPQARTQMPSNFATARNVGSRTGPAWTGQKPIADIFK